MASQQNVIKSLVSSLDKTTKSGTAALDEAVSSVSKFSSWQNLIDTMAKDAAVYSGHSDDFLKDMCGIVLNNSDTGAITGADAGGSTKTAESIVSESGSWSYPSGTSSTIKGLTVNWPDSSSLSDAEKWVVGALYSWWIPSSLSLIEQSYGINFNESDTTVKTLDIQLINSNSAALASTNSSKTGQKTEQLTLRINMSHFDDIDTTNSNGLASGSNIYLDRTVAHELTHAVMAANIDYFFQLPTVFSEGIAELTHGIDDRRKEAISSLGGNSSLIKSAANGSSSSTNMYTVGYMALRYLAKQAAANRDPSKTVSYTPTETSTSSTTTTASTSTSSTSSSSSSSSTTSTTSTTSSTKSTTATNTASTTTTSKSTNPLFGNTSSSSSSKSTSSTSSSSGSTVAQTVSISGTTMSVTADFSGEIWLGGSNVLNGRSNAYGNAGVVTVDATAMTRRGMIAGNSKSNVIRAGSGGSELWGGFGGTDTLVGGKGSDVFWYGVWENTNGVVNNCGSEDLVKLYDFSLDQITAFDHKANQVVATFNNGRKITVNTNSDTSNYQLADGSRWQYNTKSDSWKLN